MDITRDIAQPLVGDRQSEQGQSARAATGFPTVLLGGALLPRTTTFADRVKSKNGSIEDDSLEGLYDPILRTVNGFSGVGLSDLVFFGSGSAVENNSGSIPTLFDASGNEYDATQSDTAKQPTLDKNGIGGRWGADFDGSEDQWALPSISTTQPFTVIGWLTGTANGTYESYLDSGSASNNTRIASIRSDNNDEWDIYAGNRLNKSTITNDPYIISNVFDGTNSIIRKNGTQIIKGDAGTNGIDGGEPTAIGYAPYLNDYYYSGVSLGVMIFNTDLPSYSKLENIVNEYYNSIY